jgi:hypothetical protein
VSDPLLLCKKAHEFDPKKEEMLKDMKAATIHPLGG